MNHLLRADPSATFSEHPFSRAASSATDFFSRLPLPTHRQANFRRHFPLPTRRQAASSVNLSAKLANNPQFQPHLSPIFNKNTRNEDIFSNFYMIYASLSLKFTTFALCFARDTTFYLLNHSAELLPQKRL